MFWMITMLLLIIIGGWLDSRLNWRDAETPARAQETYQRKEHWQ